jgi:hypothetical protein
MKLREQKEWECGDNPSMQEIEEEVSLELAAQWYGSEEDEKASDWVEFYSSQTKGYDQEDFHIDEWDWYDWEDRMDQEFLEEQALKERCQQKVLEMYKTKEE